MWNGFRNDRVESVSTSFWLATTTVDISELAATGRKFQVLTFLALHIRDWVAFEDSGWPAGAEKFAGLPWSKFGQLMHQRCIMG